MGTEKHNTHIGWRTVDPGVPFHAVQTHEDAGAQDERHPQEDVELPRLAVHEHEGHCGGGGGGGEREEDEEGLVSCGLFIFNIYNLRITYILYLFSLLLFFTLISYLFNFSDRARVVN